MARKFQKLFTGAAVLTVGLTTCLIAPAQAGEIPLNGVFAWGQNSSGSLGVNNSTQTAVPQIAAKSLLNVEKTATSSTHTLFLDREGNVYASGSNTKGQLGNGTTTSSSTPVKVKLPLRYGVPDYATQVWNADGISFMRGSYGELYSWGDNSKGRTGLGKATGSTLVPTKVEGIFMNDDEPNSLDASSTNVIIIHDIKYPEEARVVSIFGANTLNVTAHPGLPVGQDILSPNRIVIDDPDEDKMKYVEKCSIVDGAKECEDVEVPKTYHDFIGLEPVAVAAGKNFFALITSESNVATWGVNDKGQLGQALSSTTVLTKPKTSNALILEDFVGAVDISSGENHTIVLGSDNLIYGFGDNSRSQVAPYYGSTSTTPYLNVLQRLTIEKEIADSSSWDSVETGEDSSYGMTSSQEVYGWGDNKTNEISNTSATIIKTPKKVSFPHETQILSFSAGGNNATAISDYVIEYDDISIKTSAENLTQASALTDYNYKLVSAGGYPNKAHKWTIYGLPKGLTYNSQTGVISGKATQIGEFDIEAVVTDNVEEVSSSHTLKVVKSSPTVSVSYANVKPGTSRATVSVFKNGVAGTGTIKFKYGTATKTATLVKGKAAVDFTGTAGSQVSASATYNGSSILNGASSSVAKVKIAPKLASTVTATYKSTVPGQIFATVKAKGTGTATLSYVPTTGGKVLKKTVTLNSSGSATIGVAANASTSYKLTTTYNGNATYSAKSTSNVVLKTMAKRTPKVTVSYATSKPGEVTAKVTVLDGKAKASGNVTLYVGSKKRTVALKNGVATITVANTAGKKFTAKTVYAGNASVKALTTSNKSITLKAKYKSTPTVAYKASGKKVTFTVKAPAKSGLTPTGKVHVYDGNKKVKTLTLSKGTAKTTLTFKAGTRKFKVVYDGSSYFTKTTSSVKTLKIK